MHITPTCITLPLPHTTVQYDTFTSQNYIVQHITPLFLRFASHRIIVHDHTFAQQCFTIPLRCHTITELYRTRPLLDVTTLYYTVPLRYHTLPLLHLTGQDPTFTARDYTLPLLYMGL